MSALQVIILISLAAACALVEGSSKSSNSVPPGYYAFETASRMHGGPPRVRPPPYLPTELPCPGAVKNNIYNSPKDTLCGDLNRGFIPKNPMGQELQSQPYPFEMIKNKTLHYLARSLPFLREDMDSIPKVVKISKQHEKATANSGGGRSSQSHRNYNVHGLLSGEVPSNFYDFSHVLRKRSAPVEGKAKTPSLPSSSAQGRSLFTSVNNWNLTQARQKACEQKDGIMCQLMQSLNGGSLLNTLSQAAQVMSAAHSAASTAQSLGSIASLLTGTGTGTSSGAGGDLSSKSSVMSQLISGLSTLSQASAGSGTSPAGEQSSPGSNFTPLLAVLDYLANNEKSPVSQLLPARRKKPFDLEELASEAAAAMSMNKVPPTPCPSIEEYIAPVFARNYQGVWKYVVQIPHEGYFTQTVQKTSCLKNKCDFMDGSCHESPRWVSLLVAEIFYPDARFPSPVPAASSMSFDYVHPKYHQAMSNSDFNNLQHLMNKNQMWRSDDTDSTVTGSNHQPVRSAPENNPQGRLYRHKRSSSGHNLDMDDSRQESRELPNSIDDQRKGEDSGREECDGYDKVGCYVIRVYYDWFLVPGSCKCWKKNTQGSLDALKKIFIGKK